MTDKITHIRISKNELTYLLKYSLFAAAFLSPTSHSVLATATNKPRADKEKIQSLYTILDEFSDPNPYAVLDCDNGEPPTWSA